MLALILLSRRSNNGFHEGERKDGTERSVFTFVFSGHPEGSRGSELRPTVSGDPPRENCDEKKRENVRSRSSIRAVRSHEKYKRSQL